MGRRSVSTTREGTRCAARRPSSHPQDLPPVLLFSALPTQPAVHDGAPSPAAATASPVPPPAPPPALPLPCFHCSSLPQPSLLLSCPPNSFYCQPPATQPSVVKRFTYMGVVRQAGGPRACTQQRQGNGTRQVRQQGRSGGGGGGGGGQRTAPGALPARLLIVPRDPDHLCALTLPARPGGDAGGSRRQPACPQPLGTPVETSTASLWLASVSRQPGQRGERIVHMVMRLHSAGGVSCPASLPRRALRSTAQSPERERACSSPSHRPHFGLVAIQPASQTTQPSPALLGFGSLLSSHRSAR